MLRAMRATNPENDIRANIGDLSRGALRCAGHEHFSKTFHPGLPGIHAKDSVVESRLSGSSRKKGVQTLENHASIGAASTKS